MLTEFFRLMAALGPQMTWVLYFIAAIVAVFVLYIGIAIRATLRSRDPGEREIRYQIFRDLLDLFRRGSRK